MAEHGVLADQDRVELLDGEVIPMTSIGPNIWPGPMGWQPIAANSFPTRRAYFGRCLTSNTSAFHKPAPF